MTENEIGKEDILKAVESEGVKFIQLQFMDILGIVKNVAIPASRIADVLDAGVIFDGSSIVGYATIDESDLRLHPVLETFQVLPWTSNSYKTASIICNIHNANGSRFTGDPRYVLEKAMKKAEAHGYVYNVGPEFEFFLFRTDERGNPTTELDDRGGYFDLHPVDSSWQVRKEIVTYLDQMGYNVEASHHEAAPSQHEVDIRYGNALTIADRILGIKHVIKAVARKHNLYATFMPKPIFGINGSGMHVHQSLISPEGVNTFDNPDGAYGLSEMALQYIAGSLSHSKAMCAILASCVNSYKRLVPGFEAPVYISWANQNRSALVRVPAGRGSGARAEVRNPDPAGNPYLQFAVLLYAGLDGMEKKLAPPEPVEKDIYGLGEKDRKDHGIESLPANLGHALSFLAESELMKECLGKHIFKHFQIIKRKEWDEYRTQVSAWEVEKFLPIL